MGSKQVCGSEKRSCEIIKRDLHTFPPPTAEDISFLFSPNSTTIQHDPKDAAPAYSYEDDGYENFKRHLLRTRQTFKIRGLPHKVTQTQTLEQVLDKVHTQIKQSGGEVNQLMLISGHLIASGSTQTRRDVEVKKIEERNRTFLERIIPAIHRQLGELMLSSKWRQGEKR